MEDAEAEAGEDAGAEAREDAEAEAGEDAEAEAGEDAEAEAIRRGAGHVEEKLVAPSAYRCWWGGTCTLHCP